MESSSLESEGEGTADATGERGRDRGTQPGSPVRDTVGGVGDQPPTGISAEDSDTVAATPTEEYPAERPDGTDRGPADEPDTEGGDGVSPGDTVGRVGRGETDGGGLPETDRAGRGSSRDTGESDGTDAVVVERARLEAAVSTYTPIREQHVDTPRHVIGIDPEDRQYRLYAFTKRLPSRYRFLHSGVIRTAPYRHLANALIRTTKSLRLDKILTTLLFGEPVVL